MTIMLFHKFERIFEVVGVVERIKATNDINSVFQCQTNKAFQRIVVVMTISDDVLSAQEHREFGLLCRLMNLSEILPRTLMQEAERGIESCSSPYFERMEPYLIQCFHQRDDVFTLHTGC